MGSLMMIYESIEKNGRLDAPGYGHKLYKARWGQSFGRQIHEHSLLRLF